MHPATIQAPLPPRSLWLMRLSAGTHPNPFDRQASRA